MTEPGAGSDLQGVRTSAVRDGDDWVINGQKTFITSGINADFVIVVARTDPDAGARRTLWQMFGTGTPELAHELDSRGIFFLGRSPDCEEGVHSFLDKRPAQFTMRVSTDLPAYMQTWRELGSAEALVQDADTSAPGDSRPAETR